jgi:ABC-type antimicrobial peptide transport system permease subunit
MSQRVGNLLQRPRFNALLFSFFAATGTLLAGIGMYGVVGYLVAQRTKEIGVRMALGASLGAVLWMILSHVARWLVSGALIGLLGAMALIRLLQSLLFNVQARDPLFLTLALVLLIAIGFLAAWIPARRAMRVDPMIALRYE